MTTEQLAQRLYELHWKHLVSPYVSDEAPAWALIAMHNKKKAEWMSFARQLKKEMAE